MRLKTFRCVREYRMIKLSKYKHTIYETSSSYGWGKNLYLSPHTLRATSGNKTTTAYILEDLLDLGEGFFSRG